ncbi:MAG TPA: DUF6600 domain-containing protein [Candidatus Sulfopaludibacter sp.]|jgi:hypothetical protein|nr:DUF6600 domain-containing protein [Candidatus Sulfopaludibacter sp.]
MLRKIGYLAAFAVVLAGAAMAQQAGDPPSRVARLNFLNGQVSFRPGSVEEWGPATINYPLTTGDHLWADAGAQTEFHVGSTAVRMNSGTALAILNLDDRITQLSLTEGGLNVHIRYLGENESFEVDTPNVSISLLRPGDYRISADGDNNVSIVTVRAGEAEVTGAGAAFPVRSSESARLTGMDNVQQELGAAPAPDGFDQWCMTRERREGGAISSRYVPRDMVGYEDLDDNGVWSEVPEYGMIWRPRVVMAGWAPYHNGHWAWVDPWGWTWIDDAPWGFAPFHYGRWAYVGGGWGWIPGRMVVGVRPVYAPALVAFVGGGGFGVNVRVGGGGMAAWFPLGPGEVYRPAYHVSDVYVRNMNIVHVRDVTVINNYNVANVRYVNQGVNGGVTVVSHDAFIHARPVASSAVIVSHDEILRARVVGSTAQVAPIRESIVVRGGMGVHAPPARFAERTVTVRNAPPPPPVSFAAREQVLRANGGRPLDAAQENNVRQSAPAQRAPMVRQVSPEGRSFGNGGRPAANQNQPGIYQPPVQQQQRPQEQRPQVQRNDRPQTSRPAEQQQQQVRPQQQNSEQPVRQNQPPVRQNVERPQVQPNPPAQVNQPPVRQNVERPAAQQQNVERPAAQQRNERPPAEHKGQNKKNDRTEKKDK